MNILLDACRELGVEINPMVIDDLGVIPLFSWYHEVIGSLHYFIIFVLFISLNYPLIYPSDTSLCIFMTVAHFAEL